MACLYHFTLGFLCVVQSILGEVPDLSILVAEWSPPRVIHVNLAGVKVNVIPIENILRPVAIDYDHQTRNIYWTDVGLKQIRATNILGTDDRILKPFDNSSILDGMAVDVSNNKLFYTDAGNDVIAVMDLNGNNSKVIIDTGLDQPRAVVLHEEIGKLYWTDWGDRPDISTANYDGTDRREIVTTGLIWPNGLTIDKQNNILYWCDARTHKIESVNVDGTQRRVIKYESSAHYFDIFLNHGTLYFTDWARRAVLNIPAVEDGTIGVLSSKQFTQLAGVHVYSPVNVSACQSQQYGTDCEDCGKCKPKSACEKITGFCMAGCSPGYQGMQCKQECPVGKYGDKCQSVCGNCARGGCNHVDGRCLYGCTTGWQGADCKIVCPVNNYGPSCIPCGRCANGDVCSFVSGNCPNGCQIGWTGDRCNTEKKEDEDDNGKPDDTSNTSLVVVVGAAAGGVAVLLIVVVIVIIVAVVLLRRKRNSTPIPERRYASLNTVRQSNIYSVPNDLPPAYSTIPDTQSSTCSDGYASLREYGPYVPSPRYDRLGQNNQSPNQELENNVYISPLSLVLEDEEKNTNYTAVV